MGVRLNAPNDYITSIGASGAQQGFNDAAVTMAVWVKLRSSGGLLSDIPRGTYGLVETGSADSPRSGVAFAYTSNGGGSVRLNYAVFAAQPGTITQVSSPFPMVLNQWTHLAVTSTNFVHQFYRDGVLERTIAGFTRSNGPSEIKINRSSLSATGGGGPFGAGAGIAQLPSGYMDVERLAIWREILTTNEILSLARGYHPLLVRAGIATGQQQPLQALFELNQQSDPQLSTTNRFTMDEVGAPSTTKGPPLLVGPKGQDILTTTAFVGFDPGALEFFVSQDVPMGAEATAVSYH